MRRGSQFTVSDAANARVSRRRGLWPRSGGGGGGGAPPALVLDSYSPAFAYSSARRMRTAYTGPIMRVRRSSDNTEQDIGYDGSNNLDTTALLAFAGAGSAFVVTWYDQSGNARHKTQSVQASQPRVVNAGALDLMNSSPTLRFDGADDFVTDSNPILYGAGASTLIAVYASAAVNTNPRLYTESSSLDNLREYGIGIQSSAGGNPDNDMGFFIRNDAGTILISGALESSCVLLNNVNASVLQSVVFTDSGSSLQGYSNGAVGTARAYTRSGVFTHNTASIGARNSPTDAGFINANIAEVIGFTSQLTTAQIEPIALNQGAFYSVVVQNFP